jgi:hypothetical protein
MAANDLIGINSTVPHPTELFTAAGIITFRQREDGERACQVCVAGGDEPLAVHMHHVALEG